MQKLYDLLVWFCDIQTKHHQCMMDRLAVDIRAISFTAPQSLKNEINSEWLYHQSRKFVWADRANRFAGVA